jgi:hypothetical protein
VALFAARRGSDVSVPLGMLAGVACGAVLFFQDKLFQQTYLAWPWSMCLSTLVAAGVGLLAPRRARL